MALKDYRKHEVSFCADVSKWADTWFQGHPEVPFGDSDIESFAKGSNKRSDLRFYQRKDKGRGKLLLMGEVKLPGTPMGRSAFDPALLQDSYDKATRENCRYFFTWNVEELAMFDRAIWDAPSMHDRLVGYWKFGLKLNSPTDVLLPEIKTRLFSDFLPKVLGDTARILAG